MIDAVVEMLEEIRHQRPVVYEADEWRSWEAAIGQAIAALPTTRQRWAAMVMVADDLAHAVPGLCLDGAYGHVRIIVQRAGGIVQEV